MKIQLILNNTIVDKSFSSREELISYLAKDPTTIEKLEAKYAKMKLYSCKNADELFKKMGV